MDYKTIYYTFGEMAALENAGWYPNTSSTFDISTIMTTYGFAIEDTSTEKMTIFKQLMRIVYSRFYDFELTKKKIGIYEDETMVTFSSDELKALWRLFINMFDITAPRYIPLLKQFEGNSANPIAKITSTTSGINRFNDTPQDEGDFANDSHTTTINENEVVVEADTGSIMERLDALYKNWRSVLLDWSNEFRCLFYTRR